MAARVGKIIQAGEREVKVLFTNRALAEAEQACGKSVIGIVNGLANGGSGIGEVASLLKAGMEAYRRDAKEGSKAISINDAYEVMDEAGFEAVTTVVMTAVAEVISYGSKNV